MKKNHISLTKVRFTTLSIAVATACNLLSGCLESDKESKTSSTTVGTNLTIQSATKTISKATGGNLQIQGASVNFSPNSLDVDSRFSNESTTMVRLMEEKTPAFDKLLLADLSKLSLPTNDVEARKLVSDSQITIDLGAYPLSYIQANNTRNVDSITTKAPITVTLNIPEKYKLLSNNPNLTSEQEGILKIMYRDYETVDMSTIGPKNDFGLKGLHFVDAFVDRTKATITFTLPYQSIYLREGKRYATFAFALITEENSGAFSYSTSNPAPIQNDDPTKPVYDEQLILPTNERPARLSTQSVSKKINQNSDIVFRDFTGKTDFGKIYTGQEITTNQLRGVEFLSRSATVKPIAQEIQSQKNNRLQIQSSDGSGCGAHGISSPLGGDERPEITSPFGPRNRGSGFHGGTDIGGDEGDTMYAVCDGKITEVTYDSCAGNYMVYTCNTGTRIRYLHLQSPLSPTGGSGYRRGQKFNGSVKLGNTGAPECSTGAHLHFEYIHEGEKIDPAPCIGMKGGTGGSIPSNGNYVPENNGTGGLTNIGDTTLISITDLGSNNIDVLQLYVDNRLLCETSATPSADGKGKTCRTQGIAKGKHVVQVKARDGLGSDNRADYRITLGTKLKFTGSNADKSRGEDDTHRLGTIQQGQSSTQHYYRFVFE